MGETRFGSNRRETLREQFSRLKASGFVSEASLLFCFSICVAHLFLELVPFLVGKGKPKGKPGFVWVHKKKKVTPLL